MGKRARLWALERWWVFVVTVRMFMARIVVITEAFLFSFRCIGY